MMEINIPEVHAELLAEFDAYERALASNDIESVNAFFWDNAMTLRYGTRDGECHYSHADIAEFRLKRGAVNQARNTKNQRIMTFGRDFGTTNIEYRSPGSERVGRQSQTWARTDDGWKIVSAHVSFGV